MADRSAGQRPPDPQQAGAAAAAKVLEPLAVPVSAAQNRAFSFTDKVSGFFYGQTHVPDPAAHFAGWNVARRRIVADYALRIDGREVDRAAARVVVHPDRVVRAHADAVETLTLVDEQTAVMVGVAAPAARRIGLRLTGDLATPVGADADGRWFAPVEAPGTVLLLAPWREGGGITVAADGWLEAPVASGGFVLVHSETRAAALELLAAMRRDGDAKLAARRDRLAALAAAVPRSGDPAADRALAWLTVTGDQLLTRQMGAGIYAGLPWFNDYWGRDTFIALPGLALVGGRFEDARDILKSFAALQDTDPASPTYGRVPNRARPDEVIYNTADGTPRFVIALEDYLRYAGDPSLARELYPVVKRATEAALERRTDPSGYLVHDDADTWMDAKEKGHRPWSPRGNRAVDIQALWHGQLLAAAEIADHAGDPDAAVRWRRAAEALAARFLADFMDPTTGLLADHLDVDGTRDRQFRPNQLFALDLLTDDRARTRIVRAVWEGLVYPWGVASLSQDDPAFHPYHEHWHYYHKDSAYHNGTVWLWLNGIAMQRLIELDHPDPAWALFAAMNRQALDGVGGSAVGSLAENADALPRPGAVIGVPSGTFLQAWSNSEQLRIWYQGFLGLRPDLPRGRITVRPRLPTALPGASGAIRVGDGRLVFDFAAGPAPRHVLRADGIAPTIVLDLPGYWPVEATLPDGGRLVATVADGFLSVRVEAADGAVLTERRTAPDAALVAEQEARRALLRDLRFAVPRLAPNLKSLSVRHDPPLTY